MHVSFFLNGCDLVFLGTVPSLSVSGSGLSVPPNLLTLTSSIQCSLISTNMTDWETLINLEDGNQHPTCLASSFTVSGTSIQGYGSGCVPATNASASIRVDCSVPCVQVGYTGIFEPFFFIFHFFFLLVDIWKGNWWLQRSTCNATGCCCLHSLLIEDNVEGGEQKKKVISFTYRFSFFYIDCVLDARGTAAGNECSFAATSTTTFSTQFVGMSESTAVVSIGAISDHKFYLERQLGSGMNGIIFTDTTNGCQFTLLSSSSSDFARLLHMGLLYASISIVMFLTMLVVS